MRRSDQAEVVRPAWLPLADRAEPDPDWLLEEHHRHLDLHPHPGPRTWLVVALVVLVLAAVAIPVASHLLRGSTAPLPPAAEQAATTFLAHYELASGRVVRTGSGGDTVSEGQAYAMQLAVALGDRGDFDAAWSWARAHLLQPSGLLAWHWAAGRVVDPEPAADADVDAASALVEAGRVFDDPADTASGVALATAVARRETNTGPGGPVLLAGPWARGTTPTIDPSYDDPTELAQLAAAGRAVPSLDAVATATRSAVSTLVDGGLLPPDWAVLDGSGTPHPTAPPGQPGTPVAYGFDAVRLPVRLATSCDPADRRLAAAMWPALRRALSAGHGLVGLDLGGGDTPATSDNPIGLVGAAAAAQASGDRREAARLLVEARTAVARHPTYDDRAWLALGLVRLHSRRLGGCA